MKLDLNHMRKIAGLAPLTEAEDVEGMEMDMGPEAGAEDMGAEGDDMGGDDMGAEGDEGHEFGDDDMEGHVDQEGHVFDEACEVLERVKDFCKEELEHCEEEERCEQYHKIMGAAEHLCEMMQEHLHGDAGMEGEDGEDMDGEGDDVEAEMGGEGGPEDMGTEGTEEMPDEEEHAPMESLSARWREIAGLPPVSESKAPTFAPGGKSSKTKAKSGMMPASKASKAFKKAGMKKMKHQLPITGKALVK